MMLGSRVLFALFLGFFLNAEGSEGFQKLDPKITKFNVHIGQFLKQTLENLRSLMKTGIPEYGIAPTDPLHIPGFERMISDDTNVMDVRLSNIFITGLSTVTIQKLDISLNDSVIHFKVSMPKLKVTGHGNVNGKMYRFVPISVNGNFHFEIGDLDIEALVYYDLSLDNGIRLHLNDLKLDVMFVPLKIRFEKFLEGAEWTKTLEQLVTSTINGFLTTYHEHTMREFEKLALMSINKVLDNGTLMDILFKVKQSMNAITK